MVRFSLAYAATARNGQWATEGDMSRHYPFFFKGTPRNVCATLDLKAAA
jgi:hypothetical protein